MLILAVEEKYGKTSIHARSNKGLGLDEDGAGDSQSSTDPEEEDHEGILASEALDAQIQNTLEAIRRKDPVVYDEKAKFYTDLDEEAYNSPNDSAKKQKPMYLSDYHRRNLLEGAALDNSADNEPTSYAQQQDNLKSVLVKEMHAVTNDEDDSADGFLIRKPSAVQNDVHPERAVRKYKELDIEAAEKDPETYLSNFMSTRAWVPSDGSRFQPFESDDEDEERRAELFEEAYNFRFEDPNISNEKLLSHARDAATKYSVRKEANNPRRKAREAERAKKEMAKQIREEDRARLRKLKIAEVAGKIKKIREAAGLRGKSLQQQDWSEFLEEDWDDARWEREMKERFGDNYYADKDLNADSDQEGKGKRKIKKPKWEDDIDIGDLIPEFNTEENATRQFELTEDESAASLPNHWTGSPRVEGSNVELTLETKANRKREKEAQKKATRQERQKIERLVDTQMDVDETLSRFSKKHAGQFRYRETSPVAYGLTANDILMASDSQLNQYAGLKKMAAFRDSEKKRKDRKHLGKKARLRQWRKDTFGSERGSHRTLTEVIAEQDMMNKDPSPRVVKKS